MNGLSLEDLWNSAWPTGCVFDYSQIAGLPEGARRYLHHAIAAGTPLAWAVRLRMRGEIKLGGWHPFSAEEVICWNRGMIWQAAVRMHHLPIRGGDRFIDGHGSMRWKLLGLIPLVNAAGPDISRSAAGRVNLESVWLPSVLSDSGVSWTTSGDESHPCARFAAHGETAAINYTIDETGGLKTVNMPRWGNPDGGGFDYFDCGALVEDEARFGGYTIPTRLRVGWHFGDQRVASEGEFFRVIVENAAYR